MLQHDNDGILGGRWEAGGQINLNFRASRVVSAGAAAPTCLALNAWPGPAPGIKDQEYLQRLSS